MIVTKFGGTSCADANHIKQVESVMRGDANRKYMVVSAPGKRFKDDEKVTDLLYQAYRLAIEGNQTEEVLEKIQSRYVDIIKGLGISFDLDSEMEMIHWCLKANPDEDYIASRGEYLNAKIIACYMHWPFADTRDWILFDSYNHLRQEETLARLKEGLESYEHAVLPGFYGSNGKGRVVTFTRGGSDVTGSLVAAAVNADCYENWTDVSGILTVDPRIVDHPKQVHTLTYGELRELSYMGASVLHEDAVFPVREKGIPICIRNTMEPSVQGTYIVGKKEKEAQGHYITGIAGKKGLSNIQIEKAMMNNEVGFGASVLRTIANFHISYEHTPTSIDTMSVLVPTKELEPVKEELLKALEKECHPDRLFVENGIALVAVVGEGLFHRRGSAAELFTCLAKANVNIRMIDVGFSEMCIIIGVDEKEYERTIRVLYESFEEAM